MGHQQVGHGEQGRVHDSGRPREYDDAHFMARCGHANHSDRVHQLAAHIHRFGPETTNTNDQQSITRLNSTRYYCTIFTDIKRTVFKIKFLKK